LKQTALTEGVPVDRVSPGVAGPGHRTREPDAPLDEGGDEHRRGRWGRSEGASDMSCPGSRRSITRRTHTQAGHKRDPRHGSSRGTGAQTPTSSRQ